MALPLMEDVDHPGYCQRITYLSVRKSPVEETRTVCLGEEEAGTVGRQGVGNRM